MNKMKKYLLMFAALVATTFGFTACSSEDDLSSADQGEERGVVRTEFTIAFPRKAVQGTRMAASKVQLQPSQFRGISSMELYPIREESVNADTELPFTYISLYDGSKLNELSQSTSFYYDTNSHLYQDVDIPLATKLFMFYGVASKTNESASDVGRLIAEKPTVGQKLSTFKFSPAPICSNPPASNGELSSTSNGGQLAAYLTSIANAKADDNNVWATTLNVPLRSLYESFVTMKAGSWNNAMAAIKQIYEGVKTTPSSDNAETTALKAAIKDAIIANSNVSEDNGTLTFTENAFGGYPKDLSLPDGAAYILWDNGAFHELTNNGTTGWNMADFDKYAYPAELYYHVISDIKTSEESEASHYSGTMGINTSGTTAYTNWNKLVNDNYTAGGSVTSKTRSIAIVKQVQYAVGRLDVKVQASMSSLNDNAGQSVTIGANTFQVTGLLVNGQKAVDYKFNQLSEEPAYTLYDNVIKDSEDKDIYMTTSLSNPFYTLVLETPEYGETTASIDAAKVRIAVEFENNSGKTLVGRNGLIYPKTKFYLVGSLDPSKNDGVTSTTGHTNYLDGNSQLIKKAFMQDYNTVVTLNVSDLTKAYNVLPDLSLPRLELGLSVDVDWKPGIEQTLTIE